MKFFILFISLNLFSLTFVQAQAPEVLQAENSIRQIYSKSTFLGTGFFISPKLFVTNFHILSYLSETTENLNEVHLTQEGNPNTLNIKKVVAVSALYDLVLIETQETSQNYLTLSESKVKADDDLFIIGYPEEILTRVKKTGKINYEDASNFSFPVNHSNLHGASGSPVLNDQGQIIGVLYRVDTNLAFAIKINSLKKFIAGDMRQNCKAISFKNCLKKEIENLKALAEQGFTRAQYYLGYLYYLGKNVPQNYKQAVHWLQKAARQGSTEAQQHLAFIYYYGEKGVPKNYNLALDWLKQAAEQGLAPAQLYLAVMYDNEKEVSQNLKLVFYWTEQAALQGFAEAQFNLGRMYYYGGRFPQNYKLAFEWFQKSALQGNVQAQYSLALMYLNGEGVPQNLVYAYALVASAKEIKVVMELKDRLIKKMSPQQIVEAKKISQELFN